MPIGKKGGLESGDKRRLTEYLEYFCLCHLQLSKNGIVRGSSRWFLVPRSLSARGTVLPKNRLSSNCNNCKAVSRTGGLGQPVFIKVTLIIAV